MILSGGNKMINDKAKEFFLFHTNNQEVYKLFSQIAHEKKREGYAHYSAKAIFEEIRWRYNLKPICERLQNNFTAYYARMFMVEFQALKGYFKLRPSEADDISDWEYLLYTGELLSKKFMNALTGELCKQSCSGKETAANAKP